MNIRTMLCLVVLFASCTKEESLEIIDNPGADKLKGNYTFIHMQAHTNAVIEMTDGTDTDKTVTISDYITKDNVGTVLIDAGKFSVTGMGYSVDTIMKGYIYFNGVLDDTIDAPFKFSSPPLNSLAPYKLVGADSLYFTGGIVSVPDGNGGGVSSPESRARYEFKGDTLLIYQEQYSNTIRTESGITLKQTNAISMIMKLKKK